MRQVICFDFQNTEIAPVAARAAQRPGVNDPRPSDPFVADAVRMPRQDIIVSLPISLVKISPLPEPGPNS